jgi:hypothetical protein
MTALGTFRLLGKHLIGILSGIYIAAGIARLIAWWWPAAQLPTFIIVSSYFVFAGFSMMVRELRKGRLSTGIIVLDFLPILLLGVGVVLLLGELVGRYWPDGRAIVNFIGIYFWVAGVLGGMKFSVQDRKLKEDLEKSPNKLLRDDGTDIL